jgi:cysteine desulfurase family protein (TIGR01976 family)
MTTTTVPTIAAEAIRRRFPALDTPTVLLENAGGSQVPATVADAIREYMLTNYVQLGAGYPEADRCDAVVDGAHEFINRFMNGTGTGTVILGPSSSQLSAMLADCYRPTLEPGDEIIVAEAGHEANVGPWVRLEQHGARIRWWRVNPETAATSPLDGLRELLGPRTRLVAMVHVSNLLGEIVDVAAATRLAHEVGARVVVDGVAYAPHRAIDVAAWNVDWYVYSTYKVYGPHMAALYGRSDAVAELEGPNHFFIPKGEVPYKFELGGVDHEGCAGLLGLRPYLSFLAGEPEDAPVTRATIERAYELMTARELPLQQRLLDYLASRDDLRVVGPAHGEGGRVGTISFVHRARSSQSVVEAARARSIGIRNGHMYAYRLCEALGIEPEDGVVRVSLVHYNTMEEIDRLIEAIDQVR